MAVRGLSPFEVHEDRAQRAYSRETENACRAEAVECPCSAVPYNEMEFFYCAVIEEESVICLTGHKRVKSTGASGCILISNLSDV